MTTARGLKLAAAAALLVGGLVHLQLYFAAYRSYPDANLGRSFLVNAIASGCVATALAVRRERWVALLGVAVAAGTLVAFFVTRTSDRLFGFEEKGLQPSPQATIAFVVEIAAIVLLATTFVVGAEHDNADFKIPLVPVIAAVALVLVGFGVFWSREYGKDTVTTAPPTVTSAPIPTSAPTETTTVDTTTSTSAVADASQPAPTASTTISTTSPAVPTTTIAVPPSSQSQLISIVDFEFKAAAVTVPLGTAVMWSNLDSFDHSVVADDDSFRSETLDSGSSFEHTFNQAGEFAYICGIHPSMSGVITVTG